MSLNPCYPTQQQRGGQWCEHRTVIHGILWKLRTGAPWRDLPERYGAWQTCADRLYRWRRDGTWDRLLAHVQTKSDAVGEVIWPAMAKAVCSRSSSRRGNAMTVRSWPLSWTAFAFRAPVGVDAHAHRPDRLIADKGYSYPRCRRLLRQRGIPHIIPERRDQRARRAAKRGRPLTFDKETYAQRNVVERCNNRLKQWRGLATRYEKRAVNYRAMVVLASIVLWLEP